MNLLRELGERGLRVNSSVIEAEFEIDRQLVFYFYREMSSERFSLIQTSKANGESWYPFGYSCKLGRFLKKYVTEDLSLISHLVNDIVVKYTPYNEEVFKFNIVPSKDSYVTEKFSRRVSENSTLYKSCMNNDFNYLKYYSKLKTTSLILSDEMGIVARGVVWNTVFFKKNNEIQVRTLLDRVYSSTPQTCLLMKRYARERGWINKARDNYTDCTLFEVDGTVEELEAYIEITPPKWGEIPYFDTFKYPDKDEVRLHNVPVGNVKSYTRSKGGFYWFCPICNEVIKPEDGNPFVKINGTILGCTSCCVQSVITGEFIPRHENKISVMSRFNPRNSFIKATDNPSDFLVIRVDNTLVYSPHYNKSLRRLVDSNGH